MTPFPEVPGNYENVYTITTDSLFAFETIKVDLVALNGVEDVLFDEQLSPCEMTVLTDGTVTDQTVQQIVAQHGYKAQPKKFLIS